MRLTNVDKNKVILTKKLINKTINKITSFRFNWDYLGLYGFSWDLSTQKHSFNINFSHLSEIYTLINVCKLLILINIKCQIIYKPGSVFFKKNDDYSSSLNVTVQILRSTRLQPRINYSNPIRSCSWWGLPCHLLLPKMR